MKKLLWGILVIAALLMNLAPASADGLLNLGNTANDQAVDAQGFVIFVSGVTDPTRNTVTLNPDPLLFWSNNLATTHDPTTAVTDPFSASTFLFAGLSYFEANASASNDPADLNATTDVTANTLNGTRGFALAQAGFVQPFNLTAIGIYTYDFLTGISSLYNPGDPVTVSGYSRARYALGWWDPIAASFLTGQFIESVFQEVPIGQADVYAALYGQLTWDFGTAPAGALPAFAAYSESYAQVVPVPSAILLFGSGLMGLAGYGRRKFIKK